MSRFDTTQPDPTAIGNIAKPPFVRLPDPATLFTDRAERFRTLAQGHELSPYLTFLAGICDAQARIQDGLPLPDPISTEQLARAKDHKMPPLDRGSFVIDAVYTETFARLLDALENLAMPPQAQAALARVRAADEAGRAVMLRNVLDEAIPVETMADHMFVSAAVQVHFTRLVASLDPASLQSVGDGACPSCGGAASSSLIVGWPGAEGTRFCSCSLCSTLWNYVRVKCTLCGANKNIVFQEVEGEPNIKAEICDSCRGYMKVIYQNKDRFLDPVVDDVATIGLDMLVSELGFRRGGVNPFLIGY